MKKIIMLFFIISLVFLACTKNPQGVQQSTSNVNPSSANSVQLQADCRTIQDSASKNSCLNNMAIEKQNPTICNNITDNVMRNKCYRTIIPNLP